MVIYPEKLTHKEYDNVLKQLHSMLLNVALEIKRICDENNISYFLIGGSLLGAVRHQGFIPWDDDMDIGFLREDYEKFLILCNTELNEKYELITTKKPNYGLPFSKIQIKDTLFKEKGAPECNSENGIYVDIFPVDRYPDTFFDRKIHGIQVLLLRYALLKKCDYQAVKNGIDLKKVIGNTYTAIHSKEYIVKKIHSVATKYNDKNTKFFYTTGSAYPYGKEIFPQKCFEGQLEEVLFEGIMFKCPHFKEQILEHMYGDYMKLPPQEKRYNRHGVIAIDFGK